MLFLQMTLQDNFYLDKENETHNEVDLTGVSSRVPGRIFNLKSSLSSIQTRRIKISYEI